MAFAPVLRGLQGSGAVHRVRTPVGDPAWLVTGHAEVLRLYDDDRLGVAHPQPDSAAQMYDSAGSVGPLPNFATERADHARKRALLQPHFTAKRLQALSPRVNALTTRLLDDLAAQGPPADLRAALALPLPALVICELLGVPSEERDEFCAWILDASDTVDDSERALDELSAYSRRLVTRKRREPGDDVISRLCATEGVSDDEAARLATGLLWAGHGAPVPHIGFGVLLLLANPDQWRALARDPALASNAVEETLRAGSSTDLFPRYARTDLEVDGVTIKAGDLVLMSIGAANRDPAVFPDPDRVDITRRALGHLTFGHGGRYCIGAPLARLELHAVLSQLASRFPTMRLAVGVQELTLRDRMLFGGLAELPVRW